MDCRIKPVEGKFPLDPESTRELVELYEEAGELSGSYFVYVREWALWVCWHEERGNLGNYHREENCNSRD